MWIRHFNVLLLLLLPQVYSIPLTTEDLILKAKRKHQNSTRDNTTDKQVSDLMMCKPLRQRSYLSNGDCEATKPVFEVVCSGKCVVSKEHGHAWVHQLITGQRYRCKPDKKVKKKVKAICKSNSQIIDIKIRVVESCKCVLTKKNKRKRKKRCRRKKGRKLNNTDNAKCKRNRRKKQRHRKNRRKNKQRKNEKSTKLTNNDR